MEELEQIRMQVQTMGEITLDFVAAAVDSLVGLNADTAKNIRRSEKEMDKLYSKLDETCITIIATQQPVGRHLRFLISSLKIASELERIADYANNIAKRVQKKMPKADLVNYTTAMVTIKNMSDIASNMLHKSLTAYQNNDATTIDGIVMQIDAVNDFKRKLLQEISSVSIANGNCRTLLELHTSIRYIKRVADRAINICESVFYIETGYYYAKKCNTVKIVENCQSIKELV